MAKAKGKGGIKKVPKGAAKTEEGTAKKKTGAVVTPEKRKKKCRFNPTIGNAKVRVSVSFIFLKSTTIISIAS